MTDELDDDSKRDLTVWDLAQRMVDKFPVSKAGQDEIIAKCRQMLVLMGDIAGHQSWTSGSIVADCARSLVDMRKRLLAALEIEE